MKPILIALVLVTLVGNPLVAAEKPNFIVISIDDLGYADIGPFGSALNRTPQLDRMAQEGRKLTSFYAAPVCSPSRAALMTGCYPKRSLPIPHVLFPGNEVGLHPEELTVAEILKQTGYATAIIGKWHLGDQPEFLPNRQGFDLHFGLPYSNDMGPAEDGVKSDMGKPLPTATGKGQPPLPLLRNGKVVRRVLADDQQSLVQTYTEEALQFITDHQRRPFFLYLAHNAVHFPIYPGKTWAGQSPHGIYSDWVEEVDWSVGAVLQALRDQGLAEQTLVIFTSDNGGTPRAVNRPLRGYKGSTWEGGMRVPTMAWWPGRIPAATATDAICGMFDILPTFAALAGVPVPSDRRIDGVNLWPHLAGVPGAAPAHEVFYYYRGLELEAVRDVEWKLVLPSPTASPAAAAPQLFHLKTDIGETTDVASQHPHVVARLEKLVADMKNDLGVSGPAPGSRPLGKVTEAQPIIRQDGKIRPGFEQEPAAASPATSKTSRKPNIIVILSDDMGYSDVGCYGGEIQTPNLDRLAAEGLRFTQFYNTGRCCPTRASLLTGLHPHQAGIGHMMEDRNLEGYRGDLNQRCITIAEALKPAGYRSYAAGKWHVTPGHSSEALRNQQNWPLQRGFDRYYGTIHGAGSFWDPSALVRDNRLITPVNDPEYQPKDFYYTEAISDQAARFIRAHAADFPDRPFFLYVAYTAAHWPMHARESDIAKYQGRYDAGYAALRDSRYAKMVKLGLINPATQASPTVGDWSQVQDREFETRCMEVYAGMVDNMDQGIGRLVDTLKAAHQLENTLLLFLQDNGGCAEGMGRGGIGVPRGDQPTLPVLKPDELQLGSVPKQTRDGWPVRQGYGVLPGPKDTYIGYGRDWANVSNTPFREYKHWVHEGGIATPLIVHWPAGIPSSRRGGLVPDPGQLPDIMATCLDVAGATYPLQHKGYVLTPLQGRSLVPAFEGKPLTRDALFWEHEGNRAVRVDQWKLVAKGARGAWELYDMEVDRTELNDLSAREPQRVKELAAKWEDWARRANVKPWPWDPEGTNSDRSTKTSFTLGPEANLPRAEAPDYVNRGFTVTVRLDQPGSQGVIVAQGGSAHGWALFMRDGALHFAINRNGQVENITVADPLFHRARTIAAKLDSDASLTLTADAQIVLRRKLSGLPFQFPVEGLQVGRDLDGTVGDYPAPFAFNGRISQVTVELGPRN